MNMNMNKGITCKYTIVLTSLAALVFEHLQSKSQFYILFDNLQNKINCTLTAI